MPARQVSPAAEKSITLMHSAIIALIFVGMLIAPCIVTMFKGSEDEV